MLLDTGGAMTPSALARLAGRSVQTVSGHLAKLRNADIVRYDSVGKEVRYWLKHRGETRGLLRALEKKCQLGEQTGLVDVSMFRESSKRRSSLSGVKVRSCAKITKSGKR